MDLYNHFAEWILSRFDTLLDLFTRGRWSRDGGEERIYIKQHK
jgi:hypothetical protein